MREGTAGRPDLFCLSACLLVWLIACGCVWVQVKDESRGGQVIDHVGYTRAFFELFEGAIYMHQVTTLTPPPHGRRHD